MNRAILKLSVVGLALAVSACNSISENEMRMREQIAFERGVDRGTGQGLQGSYSVPQAPPVQTQYAPPVVHTPQTAPRQAPPSQLGMPVQPIGGRKVSCLALRVRVIPNPNAPLTREQAMAIANAIQPTLCTQGAAMSGSLDGGHSWVVYELPQ